VVDVCIKQGGVPILDGYMLLKDCKFNPYKKEIDK